MDLLNLNFLLLPIGASILWNSINRHIYFCVLPTLKDAMLANVTHYSLVEPDSLVRLQRLSVQLTEYTSYLWDSIWPIKGTSSRG